MLKDRVEKPRVRGPSGRWIPQKALNRLDVLQEVLGSQEDKFLQVVGLTELSTEYAGLRRARLALQEKALQDGMFNAPSVAFEVLDEDEQVIPSSTWQEWYRDTGMREVYARKPFTLKVFPGRRALKAKEMIRDAATGKLVPAREVSHLDAVGKAGFEAAWSYEENLASYKRQILRRFSREDKEVIYAHMRSCPEEFEPYHAALAKDGLDYKETLEEWRAARAKEQPVALKPRDAEPRPAETPVANEKVQGLMTLQELRRILDGYGELPLEGTEAQDEGWIAFERRFLEVNGEQARRPLYAALGIMQREAAALTLTLANAAD